MTGPVVQKERPTPMMDALAALLQVFTVEQLMQLARLALAARACSAQGGNGFGAGPGARVIIQFYNKVPRRFGMEQWEEANKPLE